MANSLLEELQVPERRQALIALRKKAEESTKLIDESIGEDKPNLMGRLGTGRTWHHRDKMESSIVETSQEVNTMVREHSRKLEELTARIEVLVMSNTRLVESNQMLVNENQQVKKLLVQVAARAGIKHNLGD